MINYSLLNENLYSHSNLVNNPPFISNCPVQEYIKNTKIDFEEVEKDIFLSKYKKDKKQNNIIFSILYGSIACLTLSVVYIFKKIKNFIKK